MTRLVAIFAVVLASVGVLAQRQPAPSAQSGSYEVTGTVVHASTGEALAGVTVTLSLSPNAEQQRVFDTAPRYLPPNPPQIRPVVTASDGKFAFTGLPPGKYSLLAARRAFSQQSYQQHEQYSSAIIVGADKKSTDLVFRLEPDASITGRIVDEHNDPVANAQVMLFRDGMQNGRRGIYRTQQAMSSDEGVYRFSHVRPGKFYLAVSATPWYAQYSNIQRGFRVGGDPQQNASSAALDLAFPVTFYPGVTDSAQAEKIDLKPSQRETIDFTLLAVPSLHVRVNTGVTEPGQFVTATLMQQIFDSPEMGQRGRNMSFNQGVTEISGITPGHYLLQLHTNSQGRTAGPTAMREIDISSSMDINAGDMPSGVNVTGSLRFDGPAPSDNPRLILRRRTFPAPVQLQVGPKGEISSEQPVPPDTYDLFLPSPTYQMTQITANGAKLKGQTLQIGSTDVKLNIVAAKSSARIEGVARKDGTPASGVMVVLVPEDMERPMLYRRDESDSDGSFLMNAVTPGKYTLVAIENGWDLEWSRPEVIKPYLAAGEPVQVTVDGRYKVDAKVQ